MAANLSSTETPGGIIVWIFQFKRIQIFLIVLVIQYNALGIEPKYDELVTVLGKYRLLDQNRSVFTMNLPLLLQFKELNCLWHSAHYKSSVQFKVKIERF